MTTFVVGQKVRILEDRRTEDQTDQELTIIDVSPVPYLIQFELSVDRIMLLMEPEYISVGGHDQWVTCDNDRTYSGYWFDPECKVVDRLKN